MAADTDQTDSGRSNWLSLPRKRRWRALLLVLALLGAAVVVLWVTREQIAGNVIEGELDRLGLPASYDIVSITPQKQILRNFVIGDPDRPDLSIEELVVNLDYSWAGPVAGRIEVVRPRLYGSYRSGVLSFGALDPVVFAESDEPAGLPALDIAVHDGRALIETDFGNIGAKLSGEGPLDSGFVGKLAATAPNMDAEGCLARSATVYGDLTTNNGAPSFSGPVRLRDLLCKGVSVASADANANISLTDDFTTAGGDLSISAREIGYSGNISSELDGDVRLGWGAGGLNVSHDFTAKRLASAFGTVQEVRVDGALRSDGSLERIDWNADVTGAGVSMGGDLSSIVAEAKASSEGSLIASLLEKFEKNFANAAANSDLSAAVTIRRNEDAITVVVPEGRLTDGGGNPLLAISRLSWTSAGSGARLSGNFLTGGEGLPRINGRMEQSRGGDLVLRMAMAEYASGADRIVIPRLQVSQARSGAFDFDGIINADGAIPGGTVTALDLPIEGSWSASNGLFIGERCSRIRFGALSLYELSLEGRTLALCPQSGAMLRYSDALEVSVATQAIELAGSVAGSPAVVSAETVSFSYPGNFELSGLAAVIGADDSAIRLRAHSLSGDGEGLSGSFSGGEASLDFVPLDLSTMSGQWAYRDEALVFDESTFTLSERIEGEARFEPLFARDATLTLAGNDLSARAALLHPGSERLITQVDVDHNLGTGEGRALIDVPGVVLDDKLRPEDLSYLAKGVIAFADGTVSGNGSVEWTEDTISSGGTFGTERLDLAATFGPIDGLRGSIEFTDLINLTTAPDQVIEIGSINPGIEVLGGMVVYSMTGGELISVKDARWPFMGGELSLNPVDIRYGVQGEQLYVFDIIGLDAATFIAQMELTNLGASGTFDGSVPILFDDQGNGTIGTGLLVSRPPGGNVSYIGELTYEDMGAITNFAFQSLRSLDYKQMSIGLDGSLAGEIVTSFKIDGVQQGKDASRNLVTRQLASLPIRFNINVRSQNFYQLATMVRSFFAPELLGNPVDRGLLSVEGGRFVPNPALVGPRSPEPAPDPTAPSNNDDLKRDDESLVQPSESDNTL
ncbi:intermembrane phospholipid transport protein YdbH family protein [Erythrobacter crassostreae]|uniref:YdbH domain-containing protein n=1 Tax=Erythrobacter crassostreae TaxID=2828328 RepID=A0A9X1F4N2_9SPHN|nr:YdbH domain-containing protein [Erythrobacter crassostrea]MBV7260157.1 YdbH domain-containing protein [Erythrobacter crassostrea]